MSLVINKTASHNSILVSGIFITLIFLLQSSFTSSYSQWVQQYSGTHVILNGVHFINPNTGFAVGWKSTILKTTNAGYYL
ncbi:MAG: hypothetical protein EHM58_12480 [Ignavibacteriae bacterium]|nr:MAG: hypothetical protein EHM58_12480 [Ignavibacteriota bacterium]